MCKNLRTGEDTRNWRRKF